MSLTYLIMAFRAVNIRASWLQFSTCLSFLQSSDDDICFVCCYTAYSCSTRQPGRLQVVFQAAGKGWKQTKLSDTYKLKCTHA